MESNALPPIKEIVDAFGTLSTVIVLVGVIATVVLWSRGIVPAAWRLGIGLAKRKIAVFASGDALLSLQSLLADSKLFQKGNVLAITGDQDLDIAEQASIFLVHWPDWANKFDEVLRVKEDRTALIVYAPPGERLPQDAMERLSKKRNVVLNNFRGRLLNDIVSSMITTSYEKK